MMQFYWGKNKNVQEMQALSIPLDVRIDESDPRIGWTAFYEEDDKGVASDQALRNRGYMRGPYKPSAATRAIRVTRRPPRTAVVTVSLRYVVCWDVSTLNKVTTSGSASRVSSMMTPI